jgi:hypothetical protein
MCDVFMENNQLVGGCYMCRCVDIGRERPISHCVLHVWNIQKENDQSVADTNIAREHVRRYLRTHALQPYQAPAFLSHFDRIKDRCLC